MSHLDSDEAYNDDDDDDEDNDYRERTIDQLTAD